MAESNERQYQIEELLHRRTDLSTFVIHWTRDYEGTTAKDNLTSILKSHTLEALDREGRRATRVAQVARDGSTVGGRLQ